VTAGLPYANGNLHVGHIAGAYLPADIYVRYLRACGRDVAFICGSDDHGVPVLLRARKEDVEPQIVVDRFYAQHRTDFAGLGIEFDFYGQTSSPEHHEISQEFFRKVLEAGLLVKKSTEQLYDDGMEMFLPDRYVQGTCPHSDCGQPGALGDQCESCGRTVDPMELADPVSVLSGNRPVVRETSHWFFKLPELSSFLETWLEGHDEWRSAVRNFALGLVREGLVERSMTRDLEWGVPVPIEDAGASGKVLYVWFDAPIGYVTFTSQWCQEQGKGGDEVGKWWKDSDTRIVHFIGEDNTIFHAVIWPAMLKAEGSYCLPDQVVANSFLNIHWPGESEEQKISKSRGTAVWIKDFLSENDPDPLRYYLTAIAPENQRTTYKPEEFISRNNDELVATLGNFVHRTMTFAHKYCGGVVPEEEISSEADLDQIASVERLPERLSEEIEQFRFKSTLQLLMAEARRANQYFDASAPWKTRKEDLSTCRRTIRACLQTVSVLGMVMSPILPFASARIARMLGREESSWGWEYSSASLKGGEILGEAELLFRKIDV
jgi:methionyl-tRNA synthetase